MEIVNSTGISGGENGNHLKSAYKQHTLSIDDDTGHITLVVKWLIQGTNTTRTISCKAWYSPVGCPTEDMNNTVTS